MSASSLVFSSLSLPKTLSLPNSASPSLSILTFRSNFRVKPIALSIHSSLSSRFTRNVALSSDVDQDEDFAAGDEEERSFSPDLKLFVGNLPFNVDSSDLAQLFERAGSVEMVEVIYDKITGRSRGFGFVTMSSTQEVEAAAQQFNGYEFEGRALRVNYGPPPRKEESGFRGGSREESGFRGGSREESGFRGGSRSFEGRQSFDRRSDFDSSNRLYVGNLSWAVDNLALENLFSEQGNVTEARVVFDRESGRSRGFGFVTYSSTEEANKAIDSLNGVDLNGRSIRVSMAEARPPRREY